MLLGARKTGVPAVERGFVINLTYNHDMRALADRARASGAKVEGPMETLWNTVEVTVTDPDGFVLTFSQLSDARRKFSDFMAPNVG